MTENHDHRHTGNMQGHLQQVQTLLERHALWKGWYTGRRCRARSAANWPAPFSEMHRRKDSDKLARLTS
jgi:hypothetical protein